jgi:lysine/ornithine N-monooxygenase
MGNELLGEEKKRGVAQRNDARYTVISTRLSREEWLLLKQVVRRQRTSVASLLRTAVASLLDQGGGATPRLQNHSQGRTTP